MISSETLQKWQLFINKLAEELLSDETSEKNYDMTAEYMELIMAGDIWQLDSSEYFLFMLTVASELGGSAAELIAELQQMRGKKYTQPDISLLSEFLSYIFVYNNESTMTEVGVLLREDSVLNSFLIAPAKGNMGLFTPLMLRKGVLSFVLTGEYPIDIAAVCTDIRKPGEVSDIIAHEKEIASLHNIYDAMLDNEEKGMIFIKGEAGQGKSFMAQCMANDFGQTMIAADAKVLGSMSNTDAEYMLHCILTKCILEDALLYISFAEDIDSGFVSRLISTAQSRLQIVLGGGVMDDAIRTDGVLHIVTIKNADKKAQISFWSQMAQEAGVAYDETISLNSLVSTFDMSPERIKRAVYCARDNSERMDEDGNAIVSFALLSSEIRKICQGKFTQLAHQINSPFGWDDLKVSKMAKDKMLEAVNRVRYKSVVNDDYGFGAKLPYGQGLVVAFYGPPGTGKTMAASVMANELGLDIYRIDLSQISSKYIGESEKNLAAVFDAAKYSNAVLFFDEADALFAKRTEVSSVNDKHANAETAFLLQKMEEYSGISILATNVMNNFDPAFKRRITYMIPIEFPDEEARLILWQSVFPEGVPLDSSVCFENYAKLCELPGSGIKAAALKATYYAASKGAKVTNTDIAIAIDEEYKKLGHISILSDLLAAGNGSGAFV